MIGAPARAVEDEAEDDWKRLFVTTFLSVIGASIGILQVGTFMEINGYLLLGAILVAAFGIAFHREVTSYIASRPRRKIESAESAESAAVESE